MTMPWTDLPCYLNGHLGRLGDAKVPVMDRGFLFGDGVYEMVRYFDGVGVALDLHVARLARKFGVDPLVEWADRWQTLAAEGYLEAVTPTPVLSRRGLLEVDALLPRFFDPAAL